MPFDELSGENSQSRLSVCKPICALQETARYDGVERFAKNTGGVFFQKRSPMQLASTLGFVINRRGGQFLGLRAPELAALHAHDEPGAVDDVDLLARGRTACKASGEWGVGARARSGEGEIRRDPARPHHAELDLDGGVELVAQPHHLCRHGARRAEAPMERSSADPVVEPRDWRTSPAITGGWCSSRPTMVVSRCISGPLSRRALLLLAPCVVSVTK